MQNIDELMDVGGFGYELGAKTGFNLLDVTLVQPEYFAEAIIMTIVLLISRCRRILGREI